MQLSAWVWSMPWLAGFLIYDIRGHSFPQCPSTRHQISIELDNRRTPTEVRSNGGFDVITHVWNK